MRVTCSHLELELGPEDEEINHQDILFILDEHRLIGCFYYIFQHLTRKYSLTASWFFLVFIERSAASQCLWHTITLTSDCIHQTTSEYIHDDVLRAQSRASYKPGPQMDLHLLVDQTETESAGLLAGSRLPWSVIYSCLFLDSKRVPNDIYHFCCPWHFVDRVGLTVHCSLCVSEDVGCSLVCLQMSGQV